MRAVLQGVGVHPLAVLLDPAPHAYRSLIEIDPPPVLGQNVSLEALNDTDGVIVLDTCSFEQLLPVADWLRSSKRPLIALDHHVTRDLPADVYLIDTTASAAALILLEWAVAVNWPMASVALEALWVGIATDTGWFRFSNTDARTLERAAELVQHGVNPAELYNRIYNRERAGKIKLLGAGLSTLELLEKERIACMKLTLKDFERCGAEPGDTEGIINEPMRIEPVEVSVLLVEAADGAVRLSLRSRERVDVASIAVSFGGGGHPRAAGARVHGTMAEVRQRVLDALRPNV
jgi:phosphoesterase RecJ-like protein